MLGTPPAFILSQDQTLMFKFWPVQVKTWLRLFKIIDFKIWILQSDLPRAFLSACVRQELWKFILEFSGLFYCSIIKVQGLYPTSLLLTRCLRQRYISYHLCFSLSRTFLFYFLKFFPKIKSLETFKRFLNFSLSHLIRKSLAFQLYFLIALLRQRYLSYNIFSTLSRTFLF